MHARTSTLAHLHTYIESSVHYRSVIMVCLLSLYLHTSSVYFFFALNLKHYLPLCLYASHLALTLDCTCKHNLLQQLHAHVYLRGCRLCIRVRTACSSRNAKGRHALEVPNRTLPSSAGRTALPAQLCLTAHHFANLRSSQTVDNLIRSHNSH